MEQNYPSVSVITPTYNRIDLLKKCYESLLNQTSCDFEWIVIDDGSTDGTREYMENLDVSEFPFSMVYHWKENGGKHTALNASHPYIHGKYVLLLDNDDTLTTDAIETVVAGWKDYEDNKEIGMLVFLKQLTDGTLVAKGSQERTPVDVLNDKRIPVITSDCCEIIRAELFKKYPFPVFKKERFLAETALWYRAGLEAKCIYINKPVYICEYLEDGLTKAGKKLRIQNCKGGMYTSYLRMNRRCALKERIKAAMLYVCYGLFAKKKLSEILKKAKGYKMWTLIWMLPGICLHIYWKKKYID